MTSVWIRRILHALHALTGIALVATGLLIEFPGLRARVVGGYGLVIVRWHLWVGWVFLFAPLVPLLLLPRPVLRRLGERLGPAGPSAGRKALVLAMGVSSGVLSISGVVLWLEGLPFALVDAVAEIHVWFTWIFLGLLPAHLWVTRGKLLARLRQLTGRQPAPESLFEFADDDEPQ